MQLFLELSDGPIPSSQIVATNLDTYHIEGRCDACAIWLRDVPEPRYYAHGTDDACAIMDWTGEQQAAAFLALPPAHLFAIDAIAGVGVNDDAGEVAVYLHGDQMPWVFPEPSRASEALLAWAVAGSETQRLPAVPV